MRHFATVGCLAFFFAEHFTCKRGAATGAATMEVVGMDAVTEGPGKESTCKRHRIHSLEGADFSVDTDTPEVTLRASAAVADSYKGYTRSAWALEELV